METILTHLKQSFAAWHASSSTRKRSSNATLREQAVQCLSHYTYGEVSEAIGMSTNTVRSWKKSLCDDKGSINSPAEFIALNLHSPQPADEMSQAPLMLQISLARSD